MKYTCMVVDDQSDGRDVLALHINKSDDLVCVAYESDAEIALEKLQTGKLKVDLVILDVNMPKVNGLNFGNIIKAKGLAEVMFVTAYTEFGAKSYDVYAVDYLIKPVSFERFRTGIEKFKALREGKSGKVIKMASKFFVYSDKKSKITGIEKNKIVCIESKDEELIFHLEDGKITLPLTLKDFKEAMGDFPFIQFHKSFIVNIEKIISATRNHIYLPLNGMGEMGIGRKFKDDFLERVMAHLGLDKFKDTNDNEPPPEDEV
jgi:DNA-binding LytR/AlgR family response regulator